MHMRSLVGGSGGSGNILFDHHNPPFPGLKILMKNFDTAETSLYTGRLLSRYSGLDHLKVPTAPMIETSHVECIKLFGLHI